MSQGPLNDLKDKYDSVYIGRAAQVNELERGELWIIVLLLKKLNRI